MLILGGCVAAYIYLLQGYRRGERRRGEWGWGGEDIATVIGPWQYVNIATVKKNRGSIYLLPRFRNRGNRFLWPRSMGYYHGSKPWQ